jgi:glycine cleavage system H protein
MNDLVYVELPRVGATYEAGQAFAVVESVKAASDVYMPVSGTITAVNSLLESAPDTINRDPYQAGWMVRIKPNDPDDLEALMDAEAYAQFLEAEESNSEDR